MNRDSEEHVGTESLLRQVRPSEPSAELKTHVLQSALKAWYDRSTAVPWQIPIRRLIASAAAAAILISLANFYGDHACAHQPSVQVPIAEPIKSRDLDVMMNSDMSLIRHAVTTARSVQPDASALFDHLERVREALDETERDDGSDSPAPTERRSRLPQIPSSVNS